MLPQNIAKPAAFDQSQVVGYWINTIIVYIVRNALCESGKLCARFLRLVADGD